MQRKLGRNDFAPRRAGLSRLAEPLRQRALRACSVAGSPQVLRISDAVRFVWSPGSNNANSAVLIDRASASAALTDPGTSGFLDVSRGKNLLLASIVRRERVEPRWLLLTHKHVDHVGNGVFRDRFETIYAHENAFGHLLDPGSWAEDMIRLAREGHGDFKNSSILKALSYIPGAARPSWFVWRSVVYGRGLEPFRRKEDGGLLTAYPKNRRLQLGSLDIDVLETPGHCPDEVTLVVNTEGKKVLIVGDIIRPQRGLRIDAVPSGYAPECDPDAFERSLALLLEQDADVVLPAHGKPIIGREEVLRVLDASLRTTRAIVAELEHLWSKHPDWRAQQIGNAAFKRLELWNNRLLCLDERTAWAASFYRQRKERQ